MPADPIHVLHLCSNSVVHQGILRSQVVEPMRRLAMDPRLKITIVSGERVGERNRGEEARLRGEIEAAGMDLRILEKRVGPALRVRRPGAMRRLLSPWHLWRDIRGMARIVEAFAREHPGCVVHARSYLPAWAALRVRDRVTFRFVFDPRGLLPEELAYAQGWSRKSRRYRWWKSLESKICRAADHLIALTPQMAEHFRHIAHVDPIVIPCCVDLDRFTPGTRVPAEGEPLRLVYLVGVDVPYQTLDLALALREVIATLWPGGAQLTIASPDAQAIRERVGGDDVICAAVPRGEIPRLLADSDLGVLVRVPSIISRVASPVKFAECLAAGLPVVATAGIGECGVILLEHGCGAVVNPAERGTWGHAVLDLLEALQRDREGLRRAARHAAGVVYDWDRYLPLLRRMCGLNR
ncbi:glycosyltransferase [Candidatus Sumerlaeota bacterium]|nr:glycosyltransferase [Candidatus Sumerlaeota bacterium]